MARVSRELVDRQRGRLARLQRLSKQRALTDRESLELEALLRKRADRNRYVPRPPAPIEEQIAAADRRRHCLYQRRLRLEGQIAALNMRLRGLRQQAGT
jgi:hypothetical protein